MTSEKEKKAVETCQDHLRSHSITHLKLTETTGPTGSGICQDSVKIPSASTD